MDSPAGIDVSTCVHDAAGAMGALVRYLPITMAVRELMRMRALADHGALRMPLLDVGCGDGLFWEVMTKEIIGGDAKQLEGLVGIDIDTHELDLASVRLSPIGGDIRAIDISDEGTDLEMRFNTVICNCSLEHVPRLEPALANIRRYLAPGGELFMVLPAPRWTDTLMVKRLLKKFSARAAEMYAGMFDGFYQHHHLYPAWVWEHLLRGQGYEVETKGIGSALANKLTERWYPPATLSFAYKAIFKHYPGGLATKLKELYLPRMAPFFEEIENGAVLHDDLEHPDIIEWFIRAVPR